MRLLRNVFSTLALIGICTSAQALPITLNFDQDLNGNTLVEGQLLNNVYGGLGLSFNSTAAIRQTGGGIPSAPNFATGSASDFLTDLVLTFDTFATSVGASNVSHSSWLLTAFDVAGSVLGTVNSSAFPDTVLLSGIGNIKTAVFSTTSQYGIDDLIFDTSKVPEPGSLALAAIGLVGIGLFRRKKTA
jgi:hypothetical protein